MPALFYVIASVGFGLFFLIGAITGSERIVAGWKMRAIVEIFGMSVARILCAIAGISMIYFGITNFLMPMLAN